MVHTLRLDNYSTTPRKLVLGTNSSFGTESIKIERGAGWDGLNLTATWHIPGREEPLRVALLDGDAMDVPPEVTKEAKDGVLVLAGLASGVQRASCNVEYLILEQAGVYGGADAEPTPELAAQVLEATMQAKANAEAAAQDASESKANANKAQQAAENAAADAAKAGPYAEAALAAKEEAEAASDDAQAAARAAKASENAAKVSENAAAASEENARISAGAAAVSEGNAAASADKAKASETAAAESASNAAKDAAKAASAAKKAADESVAANIAAIEKMQSDVASKQTATAASEKAAAASAVAAAGSAAQAETQKTAAAKAASDAQGYMQTASGAASASADSATAAQASATQAGQSANAAAASAAAAKTSEDEAAKSAADADSTANSIKDSMAQISENKEAVNQLKKDLSNKIDKPATTPSVGKILKVMSVNEDGTFTCEWADAPSCDCDEIFVDNNLLFSETLQENVSMLNTGITYGELKSYKTLIINMPQDSLFWRGVAFLDGSKITYYFRMYNKNAAFLLRRIGDGVYMLYASSLNIGNPFTSTVVDTFKLHTIVKFSQNEDSTLGLYFSVGDTTGLNVKVYGVTI